MLEMLDMTGNSYDGEMQSPRVLHLATSLAGGAGIAARRIVAAQNEYGLKAYLSAANYSVSKSEAYESILSRKFLNKIKSKALTVLQINLMQNSKLLVTPISIDAVRNWPQAVGNSDIIHLHAFYNLISIQTLKKLSTIAPVVLTMHDQRIFTGGCHYSMGCDGYERLCKSCPQVHHLFNRIPETQLKKSIKAFRSLDQVHLISPSKWLADLAQGSTLLSGKTIAVINNPVPPIFHSALKQNVKDRGTLRLGFISENLNNPYKGLGVLIDALNILPERLSVEVKFIGKGLLPKIAENIKFSQSYISKPIELANEIRSCDAIIVPSLQDNSPSVVSESLMCGVPIIGSRVGGITEILDEFNLPSFESGNSEQLSKIIAGFDSSHHAGNIMDQVNEKYSYKTSASKHLDLYQQILS